MRWLVFLSLILCTGCAALYAGSEKRKFSLESKWVRSTLSRDFTAYRRQNRMPPLLFNGLVIQSNAIDSMVAYDQVRGGEVWRLDLEDGVEGGAILEGDQIYFGSSNGQFYAVKAESGKIAWTFPVRTETLSIPRVVGNVVYFLTGADIVYALDARSGKQIWVYNRQTTNTLSIRAGSQPLVVGNQLLVGFSDGFFVSLRLNDGGLTWEKKLSRNERFKDIDSSPVSDGTSVFVASYDGSTYSVDPSSGNINWQFDDGAYVPVTLNGEQLLLSTSSGRVICLDKTSGKEIWRYQGKNGIPTQTSISKGYVTFGESDGALVVLDSQTGKFVGKFEPGHGIQARPIFADGNTRVFFISNSANLYAIDFVWSRYSEMRAW